MDRLFRTLTCFGAFCCLIAASDASADEYGTSQNPLSQDGPDVVSLLHTEHGHSSSDSPLSDGNRQEPAADGHGVGDEGEHHHHYDAMEPFEHDHDTIDGFPRIHLLNIEHAWLDAHWQLKYIGSSGIDQGKGDQNDFEFEYFHVVNNRIGVVVGVPYSFINPDVGPSVNGFGDFTVGGQFLAFNGERTIVSFGLNLITPTGDADRGLGDGHASLEPVILCFHDLGCGNALQTQFSIKTPLSVRDVENDFEYNAGYSHTFAEARDWQFFRNLTPLFEVNGSTLLNGPDYGQTVVNLTPGVRWFVGEENQLGIGMSFPITGDRDWNYQVITSYIAHF